MAEEESVPSVKELRRFFSQKGNGLRPQIFKKKDAGTRPPTSSKGTGNPFSRSQSAGDLATSLASVSIPLEDTDNITSYSIKSIKQLLESKTNPLFGMRDQSGFAVKKSSSSSQMALDGNWTLSSERRRPRYSDQGQSHNTMLNRFRIPAPVEPPQHVSNVECLGTQLLEAEKKERKSSTINLVINPPKIHRSEVSVFVNASTIINADGHSTNEENDGPGEDCKPRIVNFTNKTTSGEVIKPSYPHSNEWEDPLSEKKESYQPNDLSKSVNIIIKNPSPRREHEVISKTTLPSPPRSFPLSMDPYQLCRPGDRLLATENSRLRTLPSRMGPAPEKPERPSCVVSSLERILKSLRPWKSREGNIVGPPAEKPDFDMLREIERELLLRRSSWHTPEGSGSEYDDVLGGHRTAPIPRSLDSSTCTPPSDEIYQDVFDGEIQNIYETVPMEEDALRYGQKHRTWAQYSESVACSEFASTFYVNTSAKEEVGTFKKSKGKHKKDKEMERLRKKYGLTGYEIPLDVGLAKHDTKRRSSDLSVRKGETLYILRMENNPSGKWLVRTLSGKVGYVDLSNIAVDASTVKSAMLHGTHRPLSAINPLCAFLSQDKEEAIYEVTY